MMLGPSQILVPTDFGPTSDLALRYGREFASTFGGTVHVLHIVGDAVKVGSVPPVYGVELDGVLKELEANAQDRLAALAADKSSAKVKIVPVVLTEVSQANAIVAYAKDHEIDLIIMGTHGRSAVAQLLLGSVTASVVRSAPCPVLTVRDDERDWRVLGQAAPRLVRHRPLRAVKTDHRRTVA